MLGTMQRRISFSSSAVIFLVGSGPLKIRRKLLISVSRGMKRLKCMSKSLQIARLIACFCLDSASIGKKYSSKPPVMILRWFLVVFPCSANSLNSIKLAPHNNVCRYIIQTEAEVVPDLSVAILQFLSNVRNYSGCLLSKVYILTL